MTNKSTFGERLRTAREIKGITQSELGELIGIGSGSISQWERNAGLPRADHLQNLCRALQVSADFLLSLRAPSQTVETLESGLSWRVIQPIEKNDSAETLQLGIDIFQQIVKQQRPLKELLYEPRFSRHNITELRRSLRTAFTTGTIKLLNVPEDKVRERQLREHYGEKLRSAVVADLSFLKGEIVDHALRTEAVAWLAANRIIDTIPPAGNVGLSGGHLMSRFTKLVPYSHRKLAGVKWIPLIETNSSEDAIPTSSNVLVAHLANSQPYTTAYHLPYLLPQHRSNTYFQKTQGLEHAFLNSAYRVCEAAKKADCIVTSAGATSFNPDKFDFGVGLGMMKLHDLLKRSSYDEQKRCAGVVLLYLIDDTGNRWGDSVTQAANDALFYSIQLSDLQELTIRGRTVWMLINQRDKARATHAALKAGMGNCLIADSQSADALIGLPA